MAVTLRGYTQGAFSSTGQHTIAWPSGTAVGDLGVIFCGRGSDKKPTTTLPTGWVCKATTSDGMSVWSKALTAADIAASLTVTARVQLLQVLAGAAAIGRVGRGESLTITNAGGALLLCGWKATTDTLTVSAKVHATDVENSSYVTKGVARVLNTWFYAPAAAGVAYIDTNASGFLAVEIVPRVTPYAPTILSPANGLTFDYDGTIPFAWRHNSVSGDPSTQSKFRLRVQPTAGGTNLYAVSSGGWWISDFANVVGSMQEWAVPASSLTNNTDYSWWISTNETGSTDLSPTAQGTFSLRPKPTVAIAASANGPLATVIWRPYPISGTGVSWYRFRVTSSTSTDPDLDQLYDSGQIVVDPTVGLPVDSSGNQTSYINGQAAQWVNGNAYKVWVDFGQTNGQQCLPRASASFPVSWLPPVGPASVTVQAGSPMVATVTGLVVGRRLSVTGTADGTELFSYIVEVTATTMLFDVPLAPYGSAITISVSQSRVVSGMELWSDPVTGVAIGYDVGAYLVALDGSSWLQVHLAKPSEPTGTAGVSVTYGLGGSVPTVLRTRSQGLKGEEEFFVATQAEKIALQEWLDDNPTCYFRRPPERAGADYADQKLLKVSRVSDPDAEARLENKQIQMRTVPFSWVQQ